MAFKLLVALAFLCFSLEASNAEISSGQDTQQELGANYPRVRRIPYFYPHRGFQWNRYSNDEDDDALERNRRRANIRMLIPSMKFHHWKYLVDGDAAKRGLDEDGEMVRRRRIPYFYPRYDYNFLKRGFYDEEEDADDSQGLDSIDEGDKKKYQKRLFDPWKRSFNKRSLSDTLANDDISAFGYDKKSMDNN